MLYIANASLITIPVVPVIIDAVLFEIGHDIE